MNRFIFGCDIPCSVTIGKYLCLPHMGLGVVIHPNTIIGDNVKIYHEVTIGARNRDWNSIIGDGTLLGAGCKVLGSIHIGENAKIGANAVILKDVPSNATVVGNPARIVKLNGEKVNILL